MFRALAVSTEDIIAQIRFTICPMPAPDPANVIAIKQPLRSDERRVVRGAQADVQVFATLLPSGDFLIHA